MMVLLHQKHIAPGDHHPLGAVSQRARRRLECLADGGARGDRVGAMVAGILPTAKKWDL